MATTPGVLYLVQEVPASTPGDQVTNPVTGSLALFSDAGIWYAKTSAGVVSALAGVTSLTAADATIVIAGTGTAPTVARAGITGDVTIAAASNSATVTRINGTSLAGLTTGLLKNTTTTGVPTIAVSGTDYALPNANTTGSAGSLSPGNTINGVTFTGAAPITVAAAAGTLTGGTLAAGVTASSLTSVGTLAALTVTATITGSISGNAATVTTNANLTGPVTSVGNATTITSGAISPSMFANAAANTVFGNNTSGSATPGFQTSIAISGTINSSNYQGTAAATAVLIGGPSASFNNFTLTPATTGNPPILQCSGIDASQQLVIYGAGTGGVYLGSATNGPGVLATSDGGTFGNNNYWAFHGTASGSNLVYCAPQGIDANPSLEFRSKGTGTILFTNPGGSVSYLTVSPNAGNTSLPYLAVAGFVTNTSGGVLGTSPLGTGIATWLGTPTSANLAAAMTDETGTGALVFASTSTQTPKEISGTFYIDASNPQGWAGADIGAWINSAYAAVIAKYPTNGATIQMGPGTLGFTTGVVCNNASHYPTVILRGQGEGAGGTTLNYTATTGAALTLAGGTTNQGGIKIEAFSLAGPGKAVGSTIGIQWGTGTSGCAYGTAENIAIASFVTGEAWNASAYGITHINCQVQFCTTGITPIGENNVWIGGLVANNTTGMLLGAGGVEVQLLGLAFDDNTTSSITINDNNARASLDACRFENVAGGTSVYITQSAGSISMVSGAFQNDVTSGTPATGFVQQTGGVSKYDGVWHGFGGNQIFTQVYNATSPASIQVVNPIPAPGSNATVLASLNWLSTAYDMALSTGVATSGTAQTQLKSRPIPLNTTEIGTTFRVECHATQNTTAGTIVWQVHVGTTNTTADAVVSTVSIAAIASAGQFVKALLTIRTLGASGTCIAEMTGVGTATVNSTTAATTAFVSTSTNFISISAAASAGILTAQNCYIEQLQPN